MNVSMLSSCRPNKISGNEFMAPEKSELPGWMILRRASQLVSKAVNATHGGEKECVALVFLFAQLLDQRILREDSSNLIFLLNPILIIIFLPPFLSLSL